MSAQLSASSGSRQRLEQGAHVSAVTHLRAGLLRVWLLGGPGQALGPHLTGRAPGLASGRKEKAWSLPQAMVARAPDVAWARPEPVRQVKMVQKSGLSHWLDLWKVEEGGAEERKNQKVALMLDGVGTINRIRRDSVLVPNSLLPVSPSQWAPPPCTGPASWSLP